MPLFNETDIITYDDAFSWQDHTKILQYLSEPRWRYGHGSNKSKPEYKSSPPFWIMELINEDFFSVDLLGKIKKLTGKKYSLVTVYANGHTYGTKGRPHQDSHDENGYTFLYYPNLEWDVEWQGKTAFIFDTDRYYFNTPKPNSAILFPGMIWHYAEETSRMFTDLRITIAWKLVLEG